MSEEQLEKTVISAADSEGEQVGAARLTGSKLRPGSLFAERYEVIGKLGQGGMSTVYKAKDSTNGKVVALKTLLSHLLEDEDNIKRFQREAQSTGTLKHDNIVEVYEYAISPDGLPYIVMEYLEGTALSAVVKADGRLAYQRAVPILIQIAEALSHAHLKNVVHRDLKPSNVLINDQGDKKDVVGILDFGLAKFMPTGSVTASTLTASGEIFGSPPYMSPEQCHGAKVDQRSDIYAFGCVMYELLTARPPFLAETPVALIMKQISVVPQRLSEVCPEAQIPPGLEAICLKALSKEPAARQQSMLEVAEELRRFTSLQETGMEYRPVNLIAQGSLLWTRNRKAIVVALLVGIPLLIFGYLRWADFMTEGHDSQIPFKWFLSLCVLSVPVGIFVLDRIMRRPRITLVPAAVWIDDGNPQAGEALRISKLADSYCLSKNYRLAEENYASAIDLWQRAGHQPNSHLAAVKYAHICSLRFKPMEKTVDLEAAVQSIEQSFGPGSTQAAAAKDIYCLQLWKNRNYIAAIKQKQR